MKQTFTPADVLQFVNDLYVQGYLELLMFLAAAGGYYIVLSVGAGKRRDEAKLSGKTPDFAAYEGNSPDSEDTAQGDFNELDAALRAAYGAGRHIEVCTLWEATKRFDQAPTAHLCNVVTSMIRGKKSAHFVANELSSFFRKHPGECDMCIISDILESLRQQDVPQLICLIADMLPSLHLTLDQVSAEIIVEMLMKTRQYPEVVHLVEEIKKKEVPRTAKVTFFAFKAALQTSDGDQALEHFSDLKASWWASGAPGELMPEPMMAKLIELVCETGQLGQLLEELDGVPLSDHAIDRMLFDCQSLGDWSTASAVEELARARQAPLSDSTYGLLITATAEESRARAIVEEVLSRAGSDFSEALVMALLGYCDGAQDQETVDQLLARIKGKSPNAIIAFIRFYISAEEFGKACEVFEHESTSALYNYALDEELQQQIAVAAVHCGREQIVNRLLAKLRSDAKARLSLFQQVKQTSAAGFSKVKGASSRWLEAVDLVGKFM